MKDLRLVVVFILISVGSAWGQITNIKRVRAEDLNQIFFVDKSNGYIVGDGGVILKTTDGGVNWVDITENASVQAFSKEFGAKINLTSVYFLNKDLGFVGGESELLLTTKDGGLSWARLHYTYGMGAIKSIDFPSETVGYATMVGGVIKTTNQGKDWNEIKMPTGFFTTALDFVDEKFGFVGGYKGIIFKTTNGGDSWEKIVTNSTTNITSIHLKNRDRGVFISESGGVRLYENGEVKSVKYVLYSLDDKDGFIYETEDYDKIFFSFYDIEFLNDKVGYFVGQSYASYKDDGRKIGIMVTGDGGQTWFSPSSEIHERTFFSISSNGVFVGEMGTIQKINPETVIELANKISLKRKEIDENYERSQREKDIKNKILFYSKEYRSKYGIVDDLYLYNKPTKKKNIYKSYEILRSDFLKRIELETNPSKKLELSMSLDKLMDRMIELNDLDYSEVEKSLRGVSDVEEIKAKLGL